METLELNRLYNMDCMEGMAHFPDKYFDLAVVDPPYGIGVNHNMGRRKGYKHSDYAPVRWDDKPPPSEYFEELERVSKNQIIWGANHFVSNFIMRGSCWLVWDKLFSENVSFASFEMAYTSFDSPCKRISISSAQPDRIHPTQKPVALYGWIYQNYAQKGDKILDTHAGSASSFVAAHNSGMDLQYIGFEIDPDYYNAAVQRVSDVMAQMRLF